VSYAPNLNVFANLGPNRGVPWGQNPARIPATIRDGTSNTVFFVERYGNCPADGLDPDQAGRSGLPQSVNWAWPGTLANPIVGANSNLAYWNFPYVKQSDGTWLAVGPLFQVSPTPEAGSSNPCTNLDGRGQGGHEGSMQVGMGDGSVRGVAGAMSIQTWSAVLTPNFGDLPGNDWAE
jgi:hypothetical protein